MQDITFLLPASNKAQLLKTPRNGLANTGFKLRQDISAEHIDAHSSFLIK